jgi:alpha-N-arabinofuranosidase
MYAAHQGAESVRTVISAPPVSWTGRDGKRTELWGLQGSASRRGRELTLTVVNPSLTEVRETEVVVRGATIQGVRVATLAAASAHDVNTFDRPDAVTPAFDRPGDGPVNSVMRFQPASVTKLSIALAG